MGLIKCIDCGAMVSDRAKACPHCGGPIDENVIRISRMQSRQQQSQRLQQPVSPHVNVSQMAQKPVGPQQTRPQQAGQQQQATGNAGGLTKKCVNCHRNIRQEQTFCNYCGSRQISIGSAAITNSEGHAAQQQRAAVVDSSKKDVANSPMKPASTSTGVGSLDNQQPAKKSNHRNIYIIASIIALLIVGAFYYLFQNETKNKNNEMGTEIAENNKATNSEDENNDIEYLKANDVWDLKEIKSVTYQNLFSSIKNGDVANFMNLAQSYINIDNANGYIKEIYNILEQNPKLQDEAKTIFQAAVNGDKIDIASLHSNIQKKANSGHNSGSGGAKKHDDNTSKSSKSSKESENDGVGQRRSGSRTSIVDHINQGVGSKPGGGGNAGQGNGSRPGGGGNIGPRNGTRNGSNNGNRNGGTSVGSSNIPRQNKER